MADVKGLTFVPDSSLLASIFGPIIGLKAIGLGIHTPVCILFIWAFRV